MIPYATNYLLFRATVLAEQRRDRAWLCRTLRAETGAPHRLVADAVRGVLSGRRELTWVITTSAELPIVSTRGTSES